MIADELSGRLPRPGGEITLTAGRGMRYILPQRVIPGGPKGFGDLQFRVTQPLRSGVVLEENGSMLWARKRKVLPERRGLAPAAALAGVKAGSELVMRAKEA